jgi:hypothetical protein
MNSILGHLRHNLIGYAALLIALIAAPTSAYAVATIRSADIVDGQVMSVDLADNTVQGADIRNGGVVHKDLAANAVTGDRVANDSLDGTDVDELTLGRVPLALQGGLGRYGFDGSCKPKTADFVPCSNVQINLSRPGRLLAVGTVLAGPEAGSSRFLGACRINTDRGPILASEDGIDGEGQTDNLTVIAVTDVFPAGMHNIWVECYSVPGNLINYDPARMIAVALGDG